MHDEKIAWITFYASICAMERHPGTKAINDKRGEHPSFIQLASDADIMLDEYLKRYGKPTPE